MKSLNIAYFLSVTSDYLGGADHTLFMQALLMSSQHNVTVVLPCDADGKSNAKFQKKCEAFGLLYEVFAYDAAIGIRSINLINYKKDIDRIEHFVQKKQIDILHSVQINPVVEYISRKYGIPHVMNIYSLEEWEWKIPCSDIFPKYVSCDSEFFLRKWMTYLNCRGRCVRVFDDIGFRKQAVKNKLPIVIGTAGLICAYKNQLEVIKAIEIVIKKGKRVRLLLAGEDNSSYANYCKDYIESHQLQESIQVLGFVDDMKSFFEKIDVFICGSKRESFPASIVEAVSCNIPVISTPVAGVPEILADRSNAYLSCGYSAKELAEAVENFYFDYESSKLDCILVNEMQTYRQFFSAEAVKKQLNDLYSDMLENFAEIKMVHSERNIEEKVVQLARQLEKTELEYDDKRLVYNRLLYLYQIKENLAEKQCYIWGAGRWGKITKVILKCLLGDIKIKAFVDESKKEPIDGIDVIKKEDLNIQENIAILISFVKGQEEVIDYLKDKNMELMKNVFIVA